MIVESPYAGEIVDHILYARAALRDCLMRGEYPFASHLLYTQRGILDDTIPRERRMGLKAGYKWGNWADGVVVYTDYGISPGMREAIRRYELQGKEIEHRTIEGWQ